MIKPLLIVALAATPVSVLAQEVTTPATPTLTAPEIGADSPSAAPRPASDTGEAARPWTEADQTAPAQTDVPLTQPQDLMQMSQAASDKAMVFLRDGGPSIWAIAALSIITAALILWKIWRLALIGAWSRGKAGRALQCYERGDHDAALGTVKGRRGIRSKVLCAALEASRALPEARAREETARIAKREIAHAGTGLRALELIATIAPLLGLLGTVLGMIAAFQALQQAGNRADPALLAGGIWEALLTTAAGMAVAIPASAALTWFEAVIDRIRRDVEDGATRLFVARAPDALKLATE